MSLRIRVPMAIPEDAGFRTHGEESRFGRNPFQPWTRPVPRENRHGVWVRKKGDKDREGLVPYHKHVIPKHSITWT